MKIIVSTHQGVLYNEEIDYVVVHSDTDGEYAAELMAAYANPLADWQILVLNCHLKNNIRYAIIELIVCVC